MKKAICMILMLALCIGLCACGGKTYTYTYTYTYDEDDKVETADITSDDPNYLTELKWHYHYKTLYFYTPANGTTK